MDTIAVTNLTKDYGHGRGVYQREGLLEKPYVGDAVGWVYSGRSGTSAGTGRKRRKELKKA